MEKAVVDIIAKSPYFKEKLSELRTAGRAAFSGMIGASGAAVISTLAGSCENILIISASTDKAEKLSSEMALFSEVKTIVFPALDLLPGEELPASKELVGERLKVIEGWLRARRQVVIAPLKAVLQKVARGAEGVECSAGQEIRIDTLVGKLVDYGYRRFDIVGERGEFSVRGGIVDIFPINEPFAVRLEFLEDKIDSIRTLDPYSQRSTGRTDKIAILSAQGKPEVEIFDLLPKNTVVVADEPIELGEHAFPGVNLAISGFLGEGEEALFSAPASYVNRLEDIPKEALIVSRHAARLNEELPGHKIVSGQLRGGFIFAGLEVLSDRELFGEEPAPHRRGKVQREGVAEDLLADLKTGDYVVHQNYGIGLYRGMKTLDIEGIRQEYLLVEYAEGDKLYVPPPMAGLVEKYSGAGEARPRLSRLGTKRWLKTRDRVKDSLRNLTQELLGIYAVREKAEGHAFPPDDLWQKELEATFPFDETPDQAKAITQVKKDMESDRPMDRLVCGDVGYGKTEVAIRAAAKAAGAGKQVALLAPTTILVEQHYNNFRQRFKNFPFVVEMLSRFRSPGEQKEVVKLLAGGGVDIVIGTHRLLSKDIKFNDLGLLIVDEEQKFGVSAKEKLKKLRKNVDVLTLTATPIPRTLYFSLSGIRSMSLITTPPVDRSPIRTHVVPYSEKIIREAILREIDRGGQVYFVHNYVETIEGVASFIKKLVPEAGITVAHGQMEESELEKNMLDFLGGKFNVLVCTSIIESGLDIPTVNTILIDHADRLGLSQLYQIRGRVGRSAARAYAYLFYHPARSITDQAVERLKAIQEFTALGSGYKLAMRDLEIRGAGNLLGAEQSGHIYEVGFDLYCELLEEAVKEIRGEKSAPSREVEIDLRTPASIPSDYVSDERQRIALYRRMNLISEETGIDELKKELEDRFGKIPVQLQMLLRIIGLRVAALKAGVRSVKEADGKIRIEWSSKKVKLIEVTAGDKVKLALQGIAG